MREAAYTRTQVTKPLLVWDGDCDFCRLWIERWREATGDQVDYRSYQEAAPEFPDIPRTEFESAVQLIEPSGRVFSGAEAALRTLGCDRSKRWLQWCYERLPGFGRGTEFAYAAIARHRAKASVVTRLFWGSDVRRPSYFVARRWFLRAIGLVYFASFVSLWVQVDGLIGVNGILPVPDFLRAVQEQFGGRGYFLFPTLCWLNAGNGFLHFLCGGGALVSLLLMAGVLPVFNLSILFVFYLSLTIAGQTFLSFQWDILLLETGFLSLFLAPLQLWPQRASEPALSRAGLFLLKLLLFKLMFMSGVVKLTSGDDSWWNLSALHYHYETQPLPSMIGWWAHQGPDWFQRLSVVFLLSVEIVVPFFIWAPRRLRLMACFLLIALQVLIALTGNYGFFNLLTIALCLLLIDDASWPRRRSPVTIAPRPVVWLKTLPWIVIASTSPLNAMLLFTSLNPAASWPVPLTMIREVIEPFHLVNGYGLFRVMTKSRSEITVEGSNDGQIWLPYRFRWKPEEVGTMPAFVAPHQPRLDWQMWFAALGSYQQNTWFVHLLACLLEGKADALSLLGPNPFPGAPPRYVRATLYGYHFTSAAEHRQTGAWWKRKEIGPYCPSSRFSRLSLSRSLPAR